MGSPKCKICHAVHWSNEPHKFQGDDEKSEKPAVRKKVRRKVKSKPGGSDVDTGGLGSGSEAKPAKASVVGESCASCGATAEIFADAAKWRNYREKKRAYMRARREKG